MLRLLFFMLFCAAPMAAAWCQQPDSSTAAAPKRVVYDFSKVDVPPNPPGGEQGLYLFFKQEMQYPRTAAEKKRHGIVHVSFIVNEDGSISDAKLLLDGVRYGAAEEALRLVSIMPNWAPAYHKGKVVKTRVYWPVMFELDKK
jgi:TonB family protein